MCLRVPSRTEWQSDAREANTKVREQRMSLLPIFLKLEDRPCLVVGAGEIALSKIESLLEAGARVRVVAPEARQRPS